MKLLKPIGGGAQEREMAAVERNGNFLCFWSLAEPEIPRQFEGSDEAWFEAEGESDAGASLISPQCYAFDVVSR